MEWLAKFFAYSEVPAVGWVEAFVLLVQSVLLLVLLAVRSAVTRLAKSSTLSSRERSLWKAIGGLCCSGARAGYPPKRSRRYVGRSSRRSSSYGLAKAAPWAPDVLPSELGTEAPYPSGPSDYGPAGRP